MSAPVVAPLASASKSARSMSAETPAEIAPSSAPALLTRESPSDLSAVEVETRLRDALRDLDIARRNAVMWFAEILARKLYLEFDCSSIHHYARERLGFSRARTAYFLRLCRSFEHLPALRESVASGAVPWTKAREVVKEATPETEAFWVEQAQTTGRRELEQRVAAARGAARARRRAPGQVSLLTAGDLAPDGATAGAGGALAGCAEAGAGGAGGDGTWPDAVDPVVEVPVTVSFTLSPEQYARYEAMLEAARKNGHRGSREELFLAAWEMLTRVAPPAQRAQSGRPPDVITRGDMPAEDGPPPSSPPRYQIVIRQCDTCGRAELATGRGTMPIAAGTLETALCDARVHRPGEKNKATIPPSIRRAVLARDGHRCRTAGCASPHFLDVHHIVPRERGGKNDPANLITLCADCHRMIHDRAHGGRAWPVRHAPAADGGADAHPGDQPLSPGETVRVNRATGDA